MAANGKHILTVENLGAITAAYEERFAANSPATGQEAGLMSASDKAKLDGIEDGATAGGSAAGMTAADLSAGTSTASMGVSPKVLADYVAGEIDDALGAILDGSY